MDWCILIDNKQVRVIILALCSTLHIYLLMFQVSIISIQNILVIVRKQNFNQNFNLIVDAARPPCRQTSIY